MRLEPIPWKTLEDLTSEQLSTYETSLLKNQKKSVSYWALQTALDNNGLLDAVEQFIESLPDTLDNRRIKRKWNNAEGRVSFNHSDTQSMIIALTSQIPTLDAEILWAEAEQIQETQ